MSGHVSSIVLVLLVALQPILGYGQQCTPPDTIEYTTNKLICDQLLFYTILPKTEETVLLDNVCFSFFPVPDDPNGFIVYQSSVYCDGSNSVETFIGTSVGKGTFIIANPMSTISFYVFGYAGCDTYTVYTCTPFGVYSPPSTIGVSSSCKPVGLSCLRKIEEVISNAGLPEQDFYILPMKLPNRCVTQQLCTIPPNPFYNKLGPSVGLVY